MTAKFKYLALIGLGLLSLHANAATRVSQSQAAEKAATVTSQAANPVQLNTEMDKLSYTIGIEMGNNFKNQGVAINPDLLGKGLKDSLAGRKPLLTEQQMKETVLVFQKQLIAKREQAFKAMAVKNAKAGEEFLAKNKKQPGIVTLPNGLQYRVLKKGKGAMPAENDTVTVNYTGKFIDGTVFDSSFKRGKPATFPVSEVIPGWQEALKRMHAGSTWELYVPAKLAYGEQGMGHLIGPNETLTFKIDLLSVKKKS